MQAIVVSLLAIGFGLAGAACRELRPVRETRAIIGGDLAPHETSVVLLVSYPPDQGSLFLCTATVVNPTQLITAAHCVDTPNHPDHTYGVFLGDHSADVVLTELLSVKQIDYPSTYVQATSFADIALVTLDAPLALAPVPLVLTTPQPSLVGTPARLVGYGRDDYNDSSSAGPKRFVDTTVASIEDQFLVIGDVARHTCIGDSGGPGLSLDFSPPRLLGVNSNGPFGCTGASSFTRLDRHATWLADHLVPAATPDLAAADLMTSPDLAKPDLAKPDLANADLAGEPPSDDLGDAVDLRRGSSGSRGDGCQSVGGSLPSSPSSAFLVLALAFVRTRRPRR